MPQQPNMNQMLKQVQKMQADMMAAQEKLKDESVEGTRRRRRGQGEDHRRPRDQAIYIDPERDRPRGPRAAADMVAAAVNEAIRAAQELATLEAGRGHRRAGGWAASACPACSACVRPAGPAARHRAGQAAGHRRPHGAAARVPPAARRRRRGARARRRHPRGHREGRPVRDVLQPGRGPALPALRGPAPRRRADLRGRGARRRDPDRAHARVPRPLPRARRRAVADRRHRPRGPQAVRAVRARARARPPTRRCARSCSRPTRRRPARRPRSTSPTGCATSAPEVTVTRLASGLPVGADLEYADEVTLGKALAGRRTL